MKKINTVPEITAAKEKVEETIISTVGQIIKLFTEWTDLPVEAVHIQLSDVTEVGDKHKRMVVSGCEVVVKL